MQLHLHDFLRFDHRAINERGEFGYKWFEHYWKEPERIPLLVRVDGESPPGAS